uniref:Uncharacterized protein n=1 Tax=Plectus sambesii TaxID=2011161 RepID=A0A914VQS5_9BILA
MIGLNGNSASAAAPRAAGAPTLTGAKLGSAISGLFGGTLGGAAPGGAPGTGNVISNVLYNALTSGSLHSNATEDDNGTLVLSTEQKEAIGENIALIQQLITQPSSPLCNPKPTP